MEYSSFYSQPRTSPFPTSGQTASRVPLVSSSKMTDMNPYSNRWEVKRFKHCLASSDLSLAGNNCHKVTKDTCQMNRTAKQDGNSEQNCQMENDRNTGDWNYWKGGIFRICRCAGWLNLHHIDTPSTFRVRTMNGTIIMTH